ncbi:IS3 family transposase [Paracraurococcus lichenis]|uniref:IS3 family transposase n=1 Tax=Paracraurococcus lichenis TaxID=3064888 RepID=A0ABT9ECJ4_9PROT|nr:IS3 family transposase [Paracraurococcus sp. LOR1-02]MDO9713942.1 IS3 family transposase [Paracraurococcus sp. LOR1-02]
MAGKTRRNFTDEFKAKTVAWLESSDLPLSQLSQELGIEQSILRAWRRKLRPSGVQSPRPATASSNGHAGTVPAITADQAEIRRLRRELERAQMERDILKRPHRHLLGTCEMRFRFIDEHRQTFPVRVLCEVLEVSPAGYYAWRGRPESGRTTANRELLGEICRVHEASRGRYGSPRVHAALRAEGVRAGQHRVARLMLQHGMAARRSRRGQPRTTDSRHALPIAPNLLERRFTAPAPNRVWLADLTNIRTGEDWLYLAVVLDLFSRRVVGWAMADHMRGELALAALHMAIARQRPAPGLIAHSDRGSQYAASDYRVALAGIGARASMSRKGDPLDNAPMESFFKTLKAELVYNAEYATHSEARRDVFAFMEVWYNRQRLHSAIGYITPEQMELTAA